MSTENRKKRTSNSAIKRAFTFAQELLKKDIFNTQKDDTGNSREYNLRYKDIIFREQWKYKNPESGVSYTSGAIPEKLIFSSINGIISKKDVFNSLKALKLVFFQSQIEGKNYIRIVDYSRVKDATFAARKAYADCINRLHKEYNCQPFITCIIGVSPLIKATLLVFSKFVHQNFHFFSSVEDAFKFVNTKQITVRNNKKSPDEVTISIKDIETVSTMLGSIMWDDIPFQEKLPISKDNPLHIIAETITVVQNDMINLREQENQQKIKLAKSKEELQMQKMQKLESLGVLAGGIAHDFNNLLGGIFGYIEAANKYSQDDNVSDYLTKTLNTIDRARGLTSQLLTFAKGGAPVKKIAPLFPFIRESVQFILSGSNISCHFDIAEDLWLCDFDKNQIGQLIDNLIINAQQAMPDGGTIEISAKNVTLGKNEHTTLPAGNYVNLSIKDCGTGISKEIQPHIFDPFYTTQKTGHGLGLSTCYSIINRHRGCINVKSEPGKGSTFLVYLVATAEAISSKAPEPSIHHKGSGMILVMDDEKMICEVVGDMLKTLGYSVECKKNGREAIDFFLSETKANRKIVAIILDLTIQGGMGGKEVVKKIREVDTTIPVFVASGYANDTIMANPAKYGFTGSISKPFNTNDIAKLLNKYLPSTST